jgi:hypothetical protein
MSKVAQNWAHTKTEGNSVEPVSALRHYGNPVFSEPTQEHDVSLLLEDHTHDSDEKDFRDHKHF